MSETLKWVHAYNLLSNEDREIITKLAELEAGRVDDAYISSDDIELTQACTDKLAELKEKYAEQIHNGINGVEIVNAFYSHRVQDKITEMVKKGYSPY